MFKKRVDNKKQRGDDEYREHRESSGDVGLPSLQRTHPPVRYFRLYLGFLYVVADAAEDTVLVNERAFNRT